MSQELIVHDVASLESTDWDYLYKNHKDKKTRVKTFTIKDTQGNRTQITLFTDEEGLL